MAERMMIADTLIQSGEMETHVGEGPNGMLVPASDFIDRMDRMFDLAEPLLGTHVLVLYIFEDGQESEQRIQAFHFRHTPGQALHDHFERAVDALFNTTPTFAVVPLQRLFFNWTYDDGIGPPPVIEEEVVPVAPLRSRFERNFEV